MRWDAQRASKNPPRRAMAQRARTARESTATD